MNKHTADRKALKAPDSFQVWFANILNLLVKEKVKVILVGVALVAISLVGIGLRYWQSQKVVSRQVALASIETQRQDEAKAYAGQAKKLEEEVQKLKEAKKEYTKPKKIKELEDKLAKLEANHDKSYGNFQVFYKANAKTPEGWAAGLRFVKKLVADEKMENAETILSQIFQDSSGYPIHQILSGFGLVAVLEDQGKLDMALAKVAELAKLVPEDLNSKVLLMKARILLNGDKFEESSKVLDEIITKNRDSSEARKAQSMKGLLN